MIALSDLTKIPEIVNGSVVIMGDFDGVHSGHRVLIAAAVERARRDQLTSILITYEPSAKKILKKLAHDSRLTTFAEKESILAETGLDYTIFYPMTNATLKIAAVTFLREFLIGRLKVRHLIMGADHHFGHNRRGNAAYLKSAGARYGFSMEVIAEQMTQDRRTSSSRIRQALAEGDVNQVREILGRPYSVTGTVMHGAARGSTLGFPTANIDFDKEKLLPQTGVYCGWAQNSVSGKQVRYKAVANLGKKPTVGEHEVGLEVHILDFQGDLYGQPLAFEFLQRIRGEQKFTNLRDLQTQIAEDITEARKKLS